jgi:opacity protein-like surface antigen
MRGIGIEVQGRDLNFARTGDVPKLRQDTAEGGAIYRWNHYRNFHPYGKFLMGFGSIDFNNKVDPYYTHETRTVIASGGGAEYRVWRNVWVRGDYEYQFWTHFYHDHAMNPDGFTIGAVYDFKHMHQR